MLSGNLGVIEFSEDQLDPTDTQAIRKASFIFHFAIGNNWPESERSGDFVIAILGNKNIYEELVDKYATKPIGSQSLKIVNLENAQFEEVPHVLYVDKSMYSELPAIISKTSDQHTLIVGDNPGSLEAGAVISFKVVDSRIRYEINTEAAKSRNITIGSKIASWAVQD